MSGNRKVVQSDPRLLLAERSRFSPSDNALTLTAPDQLADAAATAAAAAAAAGVSVCMNG